MTENIYLQDILPLDLLKQDGKVLLIRHSHPKLGEMHNSNLIDEYQSYQSKPAFRSCKYIVCFLGGDRNTGVFYGIYECHGLIETENLPKHSNELKQYYIPDPSKDFYLRLKRVEKFDKFKDRIIIDWIVPRGFYNTYGEVESKEVVKILPKNYVKDFPGLVNIKLTFNELQKIIRNPDSHEEWYNVLTSLQAVYLILDLTEGNQYVGTTYGMKGLWQRWETYVTGDFTGGNVELGKLKKLNPNFNQYFQFSILEVLSKTADQKYCTNKETLWKDKLGSRAFGLNKN